MVFIRDRGTRWGNARGNAGAVDAVTQRPRCVPLAPQLRGSEAITRPSAMATISARHVPSPPSAARSGRSVKANA